MKYDKFFGILGQSESINMAKGEESNA